MRGVSILLTAGALALALTGTAPASASPFDAVKRLGEQKAAAVALLKHRTERQLAIAAGDRLFAAYLNAATMGETARLRPRITAMLATLVGRYGIREIAVADRAGTFLVRSGNFSRAVTNLDPKTDAAMLAAFGNDPHPATTLAGQHLALAAPVVYRGQPEFALSARQDYTSYRNVLAHGTSDERFAVLTDAKGTILADSRHASPGTTVVANLTPGAIRKAAPAGTGEVVGNELRYRVNIRPVGDWTIIAVERVPAPRRCYTEGARLCG
jgi:hypothetical protein